LASTGNELAASTIVTGVIGEDIHVVGLRIIEHALRTAGARVVSVGVQAAIAEFVDAVIESKADVVFVSSSNGHAEATCDGLRDALIEGGAGEVLLYVGGHLVVGRTGDWATIEKTFQAMGFDRVYPPRTDPSVAIRDLAADLRARSSR
jgi:methylaspartate mutase sigma subunit